MKAISPAEAIAAMNDNKIKEVAVTHQDGGWHLYFTIEVDGDTQYRFAGTDESPLKVGSLDSVASALNTIGVSEFKVKLS